MALATSVYADGTITVEVLDPPPTSSTTQLSENYIHAPLAPTTPQTGTEDVEFVGHIGGVNETVFVAGNYAYIGEGSRMMILDISHPTTPTVVGKTAPFTDTPFIIGSYVSGTTAYLTTMYGLHIVDVSNPVSPTILGIYHTPEYATNVTVSGSTAYVAAEQDGLRVVDVGDPANPTEIGFYDTPGYAMDVAISGTIAYVADDNSLRIIDVSDPANPTELGSYGMVSSASTVVINGDIAYIAGANGMNIIDVSDPTAPTDLYNPMSGDEVNCVAVNNMTAYVTIGNSLRIVDVSDPANPAELGVYDAVDWLTDVAISGDTVYVVTMMDGLHVIDASDSANPTEIGTYHSIGDAIDVAISGDIAYAAGIGLWVIDIGNPANPTKLGSYNTSGLAHSIIVSGTTAYVAAGEAGLRVIDVHDPISPTEVGFYDTPGFAVDVAISGTIAYIADDQNGLQIVDISDPTNPTNLGSAPAFDTAYDIVVSGNIVYAAGGDRGLMVIDVSDAANPNELSDYDTPGYAEHLAVSGNLVYIADNNGGLRIVDVGDPTNPIELGAYDALSNTIDVAINGTTAYVADGASGLRVIDVSNPISPTEVGAYNLPMGAIGVTFSDNLVYVAAGPAGLFILRPPLPEETYSVTGLVRDSYGTPIDWAVITTDQGQWRKTNTQGQYTLTGLKAGSYTLTPTKFAYTFTPPTRTVSVPPNLAGQDFTVTLQLTGTVSGRVTNNGDALEGIAVLAYAAYGSQWHHAATTNSNTDGIYILDLPIGAYRLYFVDNSLQYRNAYYDNADSLDTATDIVVEANQTTSISVTLEAFPPPQIKVDGEGSTSVDRETGQVTIRGSRSWSSAITITRGITCLDSSAPTDVELVVTTKAFAMTSIGSNQYSMHLTIPDDLPTMSGSQTMTVRYRCNTTPAEIAVGQIVLHDPSGQITDDKGNPIAGAIVNLYHIPYALPDKDGQTNDCRTIETRPGGVSGDWSAVPAADINAGAWINPDLDGTQIISPSINPQVTGRDGRYGWDVAEGCWYVSVEAKGYYTQVSPLVGVPPEVTDLNLTLTLTNPVIAVEVVKSAAPALTITNGSPITYTLVISADSETTLHLYDPLNSGLTWQGFVGDAPTTLAYMMGALTGTVTLSTTQPLTVTFAVEVNLPAASFISEYALVSNTAYYYFTEETLSQKRASNTVTRTIQNRPPTATFSADVISGTAPLTVTFTAVTSGTVEGWHWTFGDGETSSTGPVISHTYITSGTFDVSLTVSNTHGRYTASEPDYIAVTVDEPQPAKPQVDFTATPRSGDAPLEVQFTSTVTNTVTAYAWEFGDGGVAITANPTHTYESGGTFDVTLMVTGPGGTAQATKFDYITVSAPPGSPTATFSADVISGTVPLTVTFTAVTSGTVEGWHWTFGDGGEAFEGSEVIHTYVTSGTFDVSLTVSNTHGSYMASESDYITVNTKTTEAPFAIYLPLVVRKN